MLHHPHSQVLPGMPYGGYTRRLAFFFDDTEAAVVGRSRDAISRAARARVGISSEMRRSLASFSTMDAAVTGPQPSGDDRAGKVQPQATMAQPSDARNLEGVDSVGQRDFPRTFSSPPSSSSKAAHGRVNLIIKRVIDAREVSVFA